MIFLSNTHLNIFHAALHRYVSTRHLYEEENVTAAVLGRATIHEISSQPVHGLRMPLVFLNR